MLDALDAGDEDREDDDPAEHCGDDEQSLGAPENHHNQLHWSQGGALLGIDLELDTSDLEPSLGATEHIAHGIAWGVNETAWGPDVEDVNEDGGDEASGPYDHYRLVALDLNGVANV